MELDDRVLAVPFDVNLIQSGDTGSFEAWHVSRRPFAAAVLCAAENGTHAASPRIHRLHAVSRKWRNSAAESGFWMTRSLKQAVARTLSSSPAISPPSPSPQSLSSAWQTWTPSTNPTRFHPENRSRSRCHFFESNFCKATVPSCRRLAAFLRQWHGRIEPAGPVGGHAEEIALDRRVAIRHGPSNPAQPLPSGIVTSQPIS